MNTFSMVSPEYIASMIALKPNICVLFSIKQRYKKTISHEMVFGFNNYSFCYQGVTV
ncbi:hypothetical protein D778_00723 [Xanthomarina gelatinilytica]|uniref:Uncharacterized protein n=1 Tax=Xanthomarina gelatinilytica TaxID=1137281 RepID=M7MHX6_9FLAO|nr:hypothetical protein D778_00723 [Xanthomarina gelatinilytica]